MLESFGIREGCPGKADGMTGSIRWKVYRGAGVMREEAVVSE